MSVAERNSAMVAACVAGATQRAVALDFGVSQATVSRAIASRGVKISRSERAIARWACPERRAKQSAKWRELWRDGHFRDANVGRRLILADRPDDRALYAKIRRLYGAVRAREIMGLTDLGLEKLDRTPPSQARRAA